MDGYHQHATGGEFVTYDRLRAMGTNGFQEPATGFQDGKIVGTKRLFTDGKFKTPDGRAKFAQAQWRGLQAPGKQQEKDKYPFLVNNGRANHVWQSVYLDQHNDFVWDRMPFAYIQMHPDDMAELKLNPGDLVEISNDNGSTQAMVWPTPTARRKETFMLFAYPTGAVGNVVSKAMNELIIPNYKQTWGNIRKLADAPAGDAAPIVQEPGIPGGRNLTLPRASCPEQARAAFSPAAHHGVGASRVAGSMEVSPHGRRQVQYCRPEVSQGGRRHVATRDREGRPGSGEGREPSGQRETPGKANARNRGIGPYTRRRERHRARLAAASVALGKHARFV